MSMAGDDGERGGVAEGAVDFEAALRSMPCAVMLSDATVQGAPIVYVNPAFTALTGYAPEEVIGRNPGFLQGPDTDRTVAAKVRGAISSGAPVSCEIVNYKKDGEGFTNRLSLSPIVSSTGQLSGYVGVAAESTADETRDDSLVDGPKLQAVLANMPGYVYRRVLEPGGRLKTVYLSPSARNFIGGAAAFDRDTFFERVHPDDIDIVLMSIRRSAATLSPYREEFRLVSPDGAVRWVRSESQPQRYPNGDIVWDGLALDITAEKTSELERAFLTLHDSLTGLPNRDLFRNRLRQAIDHCGLYDTLVGIFVLDLDHFQEINDSRGPSVGDDILRHVSRQLLEFVEARGGTAARVGGDEFAIMIPDLGAPSAAADIARELSSAVSAPGRIGDEEFVVEGSVGVSLFPPQGDAPMPGALDICEELMKRAGLALHVTKQEDPGTFRFYEAKLDDRFRNRIALRQSLESAIVERQFELHYQPMVSLATGTIIGAEALVRWNHPTLGLQSPAAFIPLAEASGLIVPLGEWILTEAFRQGEAWRARGLTFGRIAINLSSVQMRKSLRLRKLNFVETVERALAQTGANPEDFEFELTESVIIESSEHTLGILKKLHALGFAISIDDFGTEHATFRYLRDFGVDKIKIDRSFVSRIDESPESGAIVGAMIRLSRVLGAKVVAEGVETMAQRDFLLREGCEFAQGYLFSIPVKAEDFGWMLEQGINLPVGRPPAGTPTLWSPS